MNSLKYILIVFILGSVSSNTKGFDLQQELTKACGDKSCDLIFKKMKKFARNGSPHAQAVLSLFYRGGYSTEADQETSIKYMKRAAKNGLAYAQYHMALLHERGYLVEKNESKSIELLSKAAKQKYKPAIKLLIDKNILSPEERKNYQDIIREPIIDKGDNVLLVTKESYTLSDLVDFLSSVGYGNDKQTGSRIKGLGCGKSSSRCIRWKINSAVGRSHFNTMISKLNAMETALQMAGMTK